MKHTTQLEHEGKKVALIIDVAAQPHELNFFTNYEETLQIGVQNRKQGSYVEPHMHLNTHNDLHGAKDVIYIIKGSVKVTFYNEDGMHLASQILKMGELMNMLLDTALSS